MNDKKNLLVRLLWNSYPVICNIRERDTGRKRKGVEAKSEGETQRHRDYC